MSTESTTPRLTDDQPLVAVVHLTPIEHTINGLVPGATHTITLDHQANEEVCDSIRAMFSRLHPRILTGGES